MPPGPAFNWFAVASSLADIVTNAAHIKAAQVGARAAPLASARVGRVQLEGGRKRRKIEEVLEAEEADSAVLRAGTRKVNGGEETSQLTGMAGLMDDPSPAIHLSSPVFDSSSIERVYLHPVEAQIPSTSEPEHKSMAEHTTLPSPPLPQATSIVVGLSQAEPVQRVLADIASAGGPVPTPVPADILMARRRTVQLESSKVPSSRIGRLFHYGGLAASLGYGAAAELVRRSTTTGSESSAGSLMLTEANIKRLVSKLTKMRGAALKIGQFMSIQDSHVLPPEVEDMFRRVQDGANYMPDWQMEEVMRTSLGPSWQESFVEFDRIPFAAASIGQVHSAVLAASASPTGKEERVAVKIQFPNIVNSIESDLGYVKMLLTAGRLLPKGLFLDRTIEVMKSELADECDYTREATFLRRFGDPSHLGNDPRFKVPWVWDGCTERVLVMEHVDGVSVGGSAIDQLSQEDKDDIATRIIDLCLKELFTFRVMQTDPNWTNFLWNTQTRQMALVDFGATREYSSTFIDSWLQLLQAASNSSRADCISWSLKVGYLTGEENELMLDAHAQSMILLATPFMPETPQPFKFGGEGSVWGETTRKIRELIPVMLANRLTPPPRETYSLNRKLSGAFLLAARLNARVDCRRLWENVVQNYKFSGTDPVSS
ncbi:ABC1-domain-containing protein [Cristinia sonorae]|uniref:ABC1-domain-containing protein n=1 Tax=Cristinia sonorae TaxID=1940300 RepID=A0A8K0XK13_9AGAR|nr:ABC1-domain-containing protein [Cristinia sonorae]